MANNNPIRILHFSDFHLNGNKIADAELVLTKMLNAIKSTNQQIDLVIFSGDMIEQGGKGFSNIKEAFKSFKENVIDELCDGLSIDPERFIFTPGNHDVEINADKKSLDEYLNNHALDSKTIVDLVKNDDDLKDSKKLEAFKSFEKEYYDKCSGITYCYDKFTSTFELNINGCFIGISSLNTVWKCGRDYEYPVMGICQITEHIKHLKNKDIRIAISHFPYYKLEKEWNEVEELLSEKFDIYFSGHTHYGKNRFISAYKGNFFLDTNTFGTLAANTYENDKKYKNAFQIIEVYSNEKYQIRKYVQSLSLEFELYRNDEFKPNGILELVIPQNSARLEQIFNDTLVFHRIQQEDLFKSKIFPFVTLDKFINRPNNKVMENEFIPFTRFYEIQKTLLESKEKNIRFIANPGMGKTRIVAESYRDCPDNVFYTNTSDCEVGLSNILEQAKENIVLIIDNCDMSHLRQINKIVDEYGANVRIISIYNINIDEEKGTGNGLIELKQSDTKDVVKKMIDRETMLSGKENLKEVILEDSGDIPLMAKLLIEAYSKTKTLQIEDPDIALAKFIDGSEHPNTFKMESLCALSLFDPLGFDDDKKDEFEFLVDNECIHRINNDSKEYIRTTLKNTIEDFQKRELIEHYGKCIRIRPRPLAEWLTSKWIQTNENHFEEIVEQICMLHYDLNDRLSNALKRRFEGMKSNKKAKKLFDKINNPQNGSFHNERIAFSEAGSQLFLSMGTVSPVMVAKNLLSLLEMRENDLKWIKVNVAAKIRRNIVFALERMCRDKEAFSYVAKSLLILAAAENETFSNNATGQFAQMFLLPATLTPLSSRIEVLKENVNKVEYIPIIIRAIDSAFKSQGFVFFDEATKPLTEKKYYTPSAPEIKDYWGKCAELLIDISQKTTNYDQSIKNIIQKHVYDMYNFGGENTLGKLVNYFGAKCDYEWPELRKALNFYINHWNDGNMIKRDHALVLYERFSPKSFFLRVKDVISNKYIQNKPDFAKLDSEMYELMQPYAKEFVNDKIYLTPELESMIKDLDFQSHWLLHEIVNIICVNTSAIKEILDAIVIYLKKEEFNIESPFITQFCLELTKRKDASIIQIEKVFQSKLYELGYYRLSASISGIIEDEEFSYLDKIIKGVKKGKYDNYCVNNYLRRQNLLSGIAKTIYITNKLIEEKFDEDEVIFPYFTNCMRFQINGISELDEIEEILLLYTFSNGTFNTASQVVEIMSDILQKYDRPLFALKVHNKIVDVLSKSLSINNPFENIYQTLLPKYQDKILDQVLEDIANDSKFNYYFKMKNYLGSGFEYGKGPLFCCDYDRLFNACLRFPNTLPDKLSVMCPVIEPNKKPNETFFWRLCDNFGNDKDMLEGFYCNVCTLGFAGYSLSKQLLNCIDIIKPYIKHPNKTVQEWAQKTIESLQQDATERKRQEEYREITSE